MKERAPFDQQLLQKLTESIESNLQNEHFGVTELAQETGFSKSQLNRKIKAILGQTPNQFIREYRLKKAMQLLQDNVVTATEAAYLVGFGSPSYFSTCFRDFYGYPPSEVSVRSLKESTPVKAGLNKGQWISLSILALIAPIVIVYFIFSSRTSSKQSNPVYQEKSIAVLPFKNLSIEQDDQYLADGVQQAIQHHLTRIGDLNLRSAVSTETYRDTKLNSKQIGKQLEVNYILTGTFQKVADQAHLNVQLIETRDDKLMWSEEYIENWSNIFEIQKRIARKVSEDLYVSISEEVAKAFELIPTKNMTAYELYLHGINYYSSWWTNRDKAKLDLALKYYEQATALDENFSLAYTAMGETYGTLANIAIEPDRSRFLHLSKINLGKAIKLNPYSGWAYAELETIINTWKWDSTSARNNIETALRLEPNNYNTLNIYFHHEFWLANCDKLQSIIQRIARIDPQVHKPDHHYNLKLLQCQNKYSEIAAIADKYSKNTNHIMIARLYFLGYLYSSRFDEAERMLKYITEHSKLQWMPLFYGALLNAKRGVKHIALQNMEELQLLSSMEQISNIWYARIYAALGDKAMMYQNLELALQDKDWRIHVINANTEFFPYLDEERFQEIWKESWEHMVSKN